MEMSGKEHFIDSHTRPSGGLAAAPRVAMAEWEDILVVDMGPQSHSTVLRTIVTQ